MIMMLATPTPPTSWATAPRPRNRLFRAFCASAWAVRAADGWLTVTTSCARRWPANGSGRNDRLAGAQQERLIEALLILALSQRGLQRREPFDLAAVTEEALLARQPEAGHLGLKISANLSASRLTSSITR